MAMGVGRQTLPSLRQSASGTIGSAFASAAAAFEAPERQAAVLALEPLYSELPDPILHTIAEGVEPAGPHLGNPDLPEEMLKELGRFVRDNRKDAVARQEARTTRTWSFVEKAVLLVIGGIVTLALKALFF